METNRLVSIVHSLKLLDGRRDFEAQQNVFGAISLKSCKNAPFDFAFLSAHLRLKLLDLFSLVMLRPMSVSAHLTRVIRYIYIYIYIYRGEKCS